MWWHLFASVLTVVLLWVGSKAPARTFMFILGLILFLAVLQIVFSSYMRDMFVRSLSEGFKWSDWSYLLFAVERLAWPIMIVSIFRTQISDPWIAASLSNLLLPFKYLGLNINRLQGILILALRFLPSLRREWDRLAFFQTYFTGKRVQRSLRERIAYTSGILKAMISHAIHRAVNTGNMLAIRGMPGLQSKRFSDKILVASVPWLTMGILSYTLSHSLFVLWCVMTIWMVIAAVSLVRSA